MQNTFYSYKLRPISPHMLNVINFAFKTNTRADIYFWSIINRISGVAICLIIFFLLIFKQYHFYSWNSWFSFNLLDLKVIPYILTNSIFLYGFLLVIYLHTYIGYVHLFEDLYPNKVDVGGIKEDFAHRRKLYPNAVKVINNKLKESNGLHFIIDFGIIFLIYFYQLISIKIFSINNPEALINHFTLYTNNFNLTFWL